MNYGFAAMRARMRQENFNKAVENTISKLAEFPNKTIRISTKLAKYILINYETIISNRKSYSTQVRNIGAGVKEIYLKEVK